MIGLPPDPCAGGVADFWARLRRGETTAEAATAAYLERIRRLEPRLGAFECVLADQAPAAARALDRLLASGTDLGPLMGVPMTVKDLFAVHGTTTTAGSNIDLSDVIGAEGSFMALLRRLGCVILGKTKLPEFAMGSVGRGNVSHLRGSPWNPWDSSVQRTAGGSSSGSAVAVAAGLCAFSIGTDTGGSIRLPSAYCGTFGLKATAGRWPTDGMFPQSPVLDSLGPMTRTAADAALVFAALTETPPIAPAEPRGLRFAKPVNHFFEELDPPVARCVEAALAALERAGVTIVPAEIPEVAEPKRDFGAFVPADLIAVLGRERFIAERARMDPLIAPRVAAGLDVRADDYIRLAWRRRELAAIARERMRGFDGWVLPSCGMVAPPIAEIAGRDFDSLMAEMSRRRTHRRMAANFLDLCAFSIPVHGFGSDLPVGLQVMCAANAERKALAIALRFERIFGPPSAPDLSGFLA